MPRKKKEEEAEMLNDSEVSEKSEVVEDLRPDSSKEPLSSPPPVAKAAKPKKAKPERKFNFEQWAKRRGVKTHHMSGLRAFCQNPNKPRTLSDWDTCFQDY